MTSADDKLEALSHAIRNIRWVRGEPEHPQYRTFVALKSLAADVKGAQPIVVLTTLRTLDRRMDEAKRAGFPQGHMIGLAQELIGRWPTVRQALERFERETAA